MPRVVLAQKERRQIPIQHVQHFVRMNARPLLSAVSHPGRGWLFYLAIILGSTLIFLLLTALLDIAAVLGREFGHELIRAVSPLDDATLVQHLDQLVTGEFLYQRGVRES